MCCKFIFNLLVPFMALLQACLEPVIIILFDILYCDYQRFCIVRITSDSFLLRMFVVTLRDPNR